MKLIRYLPVILTLFAITILPANAQLKDFRQNIQITKGAIRDNLMEEKKSALEKINNLQNNYKNNKEEIRKELQAKRDEFKQKIKTLKNEKKKTAAERIDENLTKINTKRTDQMNKDLDRLRSVLDKISSKTADLKTGGADVSTTETAITAADTAIQTAKDKVSEQADKAYIAQITDESTLGQSISKVVQQLKSDLLIVHQAVLDAQKAVRNAAHELAKLKQDKNTKGITPGV